MIRAWLKKIFTLFDDPRILRILAIMTFSALIIIVVNFYTMKTMSGIRAYINGESEYSKGEKEAAINLMLYVQTEDEKYWNAFLKNEKIPHGDSVAREGLIHGASRETIRQGFLDGRNHREDVDKMIWLFTMYKNTSMLKEPIETWRKGDSLVYVNGRLARMIHHQLSVGDQTDAQREQWIREIAYNSGALTELERRFSHEMGNLARKVTTYLFIFNLSIILIVFIGVKIYATRILNQLKSSNHDLQDINRELDRFVYSASHDLRAPISSMKGLVTLALIETKPEQLRLYLDHMMVTLERQDKFIRDIIDFSRNKRIQVTRELIKLHPLFEKVVHQHRFMPGASKINFTTDIRIAEIRTDPLRLEIILNNLVSNAIKYMDSRKEEPKIIIRAMTEHADVIIEVEDNGSGIKSSDKEKVFDMFYVTQHQNKGSGLGLYITAETALKLNGKLSLRSEHGKGSVFRLTLPKY